MRLIRLSARNYKSYFKTQQIVVAPGFNVFLGANNAGKTTMLEALDMDVGVNIPHQSVQNLPIFGMLPTGNSMLGIGVTTNLFALGASIPRLGVLLPKSWQASLPSRPGSSIQDNVTHYLSTNPTLEFHLEFGAKQTDVEMRSAFGLQKINKNERADCVMLEINDGGNLRYINMQSVSNANEIPNIGLIFGHTKSVFYRFSANRRPAGKCGETPHPVELVPDASNLPYCLNVLQSTDSHGHKILCDWVQRIFPAVKWVQAIPRPGNQFEIECLPVSPNERRYDLAVPLEKMGTGIGNVIAMLYVVLKARIPKVIAIDEPNSFLHPKALRELLQIFSNEGRQHQYLLTAHSADVLNSVPASFITTFQVENGATVTQQFKGSEISSVRGALSDLGIRMTDLHGRDRVLWVEGQTEELVIPELLKAFCPEIAAGTGVLRVEHTSKFDRTGQEVKEVVGTYERLTSFALVPPSVAILIDTEKRSERACKKLEADTNGKLRFLPKTMLENYALDAGAITSVLQLAGEKITVAGIQSLLEHELGQEHANDGAKILKNIFSIASEARVEFRKTTHTPQLFSWLLQEQPQQLDSLRAFLREMFGI